MKQSGGIVGTADTVTKQYMGNKEIFADACNFLFGEGKVKASELSEISETEVFVPQGRHKHRGFRKKYRDGLMKRTTIMEDGKAFYILLGNENQTEVNYAMPVRIMEYDAMRYQAQIEKLAREHREKNEFKNRPRKEFLSGLLETDRLIPIVTIVVYFGPENWDGARDLHGLMNIPDESLKEWVSNYQIHVIEPAMISDEEMKRFKTSLREVLTAAKYAKDKQKLQQAVRENGNYEKLDRSVIPMLEVITGERFEIAEEEETFNMCKALEDIRSEGRQEGRLEGRIEGRQEGLHQGSEKTAVQFILKMHQHGMDTESIAEISEKSVAEIEALLKKNL